MSSFLSSASRLAKNALLGTSVAVAVAMFSGAAYADIAFDPKNDPQPDEENILFGAKFTNSTDFFGGTNQTGVPIEFKLIPGFTVQSTTGHMTTETGIGTNGTGQADIICNAGCGAFSSGGPDKGAQIEDLEIKVGAGFGATDFIGNLDFGEGTFKITVTDQGGTSFTYMLGNGQNFFTLTASNNEVITDIVIEGMTPDGSGDLGFDAFKQPRISGLCALTANGTCVNLTVPEPSSLAVVGAGLMAAGWFAKRRKTRRPA